MAPKKNPKVTSSSTQAARIKGGSNPVVTKGEARTRAARTALGSASPQRPMASGGTKGPLQGGTRTGGQYGAAAPTRPMPSGRGQGPLPNRNMASRLSDKPKPATPRGITMSGDKQAAIKAGGTRPAPKPAFGPVPSGPSERTIRSMEAKPATVKGGMSQQSTLSSKPGANAAANATRAQAAKDAARMANRVAKGYGGMSAQQTANVNKVGNSLRGVGGVMRGAGVRGGVFGAGISANNTADATLTAMAPKVAKQLAAMKNKVGPKMVGPKKVGTGKVGTIAQSFDKAFASARKAGKATFTHMGKKYTTKMK